MAAKFNEEDQSRKVAVLYRETQKWKSDLNFLEVEANFIKQLLNSYVFVPNTPNLFERLQSFLERTEICVKHKQEVGTMITKHEKVLGGMLECRDETCDFSYYRLHENIRETVLKCMHTFRILKSEVFNYAGNILKNRKEE